MHYSSPSEYLKQLRMQKFYVNKFRVNYANANKLTPIILQYLKYLNDEINYVENYMKKRKEKNDKLQVTIYDFKV